MQRRISTILLLALGALVALPATATADDVLAVFQEAWRLGLKSISVYRDGSKGGQPLSSRPLDA